MALLQQYSCCGTGSSLSSTVSFSSRVPRRVVSQLQRAQKTQLRVSICRASSGETSAADVARPEAERSQQFFKDESTGVVCYHDKSGDVTCEGWDEGPHFQPDIQRPPLRRRRFAPRTFVQGRNAQEAVKFENVEGRMKDSLTEVANESLECSEL